MFLKKLLLLVALISATQVSFAGVKGCVNFDDCTDKLTSQNVVAEKQMYDYLNSEDELGDDELFALSEKLMLAKGQTYTLCLYDHRGNIICSGNYDEYTCRRAAELQQERRGAVAWCEPK